MRANSDSTRCNPPGASLCHCLLQSANNARKRLHTREKSGRRSDRCKHAMIRANRREFLLLRRNFQVLTSAVSSKGRGVHRLTRAKNGTPTQRLYKLDKMLSPPYTACLANRVWFLCVISKICGGVHRVQGQPVGIPIFVQPYRCKSMDSTSSCNKHVFRERVLASAVVFVRF